MDQKFVLDYLQGQRTNLPQQQGSSIAAWDWIQHLNNTCHVLICDRGFYVNGDKILRLHAVNYSWKRSEHDGRLMEHNWIATRARSCMTRSTASHSVRFTSCANGHSNGVGVREIYSIWFV